MNIGDSILFLGFDNNGFCRFVDHLHVMFKSADLEVGKRYLVADLDKDGETPSVSLECPGGSTGWIPWKHFGRSAGEMDLTGQ